MMDQELQFLDVGEHGKPRKIAVIASAAEPAAGRAGAVAKPGLVWLQRMAATYPKAVWINPSAEKYWDYSPSISLISRTFEDRMFPLTLDGLDQAMRELVR